MAKALFEKITPEMEQELRDTANMDSAISAKAMKRVVAALQLPLNEAVWDGDILGGIFQAMPFKPGVETRFPLDFVAPGSETDYCAYTMPATGYIPERHVEGDYVVVPTYKVAVALDWAIQYAEDARWDVMGGVTKALKGMLTNKINYDGWRVIIGAGYDRNLTVVDTTGTDGILGKRTISLMKLGMRRNSGGNTASVNRSTLTDLYISPEGMDDIRNWDVDEVDEITRREIFVAREGGLSKIFGVNLHELDELGEGQGFQSYYVDTLGGSVGSEKEIIVGLCLADSYADKFVMPVVSELKLYDDPALLRQGRQGVFGWQRHGFAMLDNRAVLIGRF